MSSRRVTQCQAKCGRPAGTGFLCKPCLGDLRKALAETPFLTYQLTIVITRQTVYTGRYGGRSTELPLPFHVAASDTRAKLHQVLESWAAQLIRDTCPRSPRPEHVSQWMLGQLESIRNYHRAGELVHDLTAVTKRARWLIDRPPDKWFAGPCDRCGYELYGETGKGQISCRHCDARYDIGQRRDHLLQAAEDTLATAAIAARAVSWLGEAEVTPKRIHMWVSRKRLVAKGHEPYASPADPDRTRPLYRVGDIIDLLAETSREAPK